MATTPLVSVEAYLETQFVDGDREYLEGQILERNVGEIDHGDLQGTIYYYLRSRYGDRLWTGVEIRVQVSRNRFHVPDIVVVEGSRPQGRIITMPPLLVIEVRSRDDRAEDIQERIDDYLGFGVRFVWVVNPRTPLAGSRAGSPGAPE
jgi:Uma2 family endonuclease